MKVLVIPIKPILFHLFGFMIGDYYGLSPVNQSSLASRGLRQHTLLPWGRVLAV